MRPSRATQAARRWYWQRLTAMAMAVCVAIHLTVMIYAIQGGLSAAEILSRTRGNLAWATFYAAFVLLVSVHAAIGLRQIGVEWLRLKDATAGLLSWAIGLLLLALGLRAVWAVTWGAA